MTCPQDVSASGIRSPFWRAVRFVQNVLASQFCVQWSAQPAELLVAFRRIVRLWPQPAK